MSLEILNKYKIKAKKSLGQNFLVNDDIVEEIADAINVEGENIVEVGPGYGALTEKLIARKPKSLNLVELDIDMINILEKRIKNNDFDLNGIDFHINNVDVLKYEPTQYKTNVGVNLCVHPENKSENIIGQTHRSAPTVGGNLCVHPETMNVHPEYKYSVIANIPYYITSPILRHFLYDVKTKPENMVILMQKDVGDKILSGQNFGMNNEKGIMNNKKMKSSVISLFVSKKSYVDELIIVGKQNFIPAPKVESSVLVFELHDEYKDIDDNDFIELIKKGFKEPRKMLVKNLVTSGFDKNYITDIFSELGIDLNVRGEDLDISIWCELCKKIYK